MIPAGTALVLEPLCIQTSTRLWGSDAKEFNPERFLPENICNVHPYAFIPFFQGQRKCIGYKFAWILMKICVADILRNFSLTTSVKYGDIELQLEFLLKIKPGYFIKFDEREDFC